MVQENLYRKLEERVDKDKVQRILGDIMYTKETCENKLINDHPLDISDLHYVVKASVIVPDL